MAKVRLSRKFRTFLKMFLISAINPKNPRAQGHVHRCQAESTSQLLLVESWQNTLLTPILRIARSVHIL